MTAQVKEVHLNPRSVRKLNEEQLIAWDGADRADVQFTGERVERVEDQTDVGMIRTTHDFPGVTMIVYVLSPGERFVANRQIATRRPLAQLREVVRDPVDTS